MTAPRAAVVVVTHRSRDDALACLDSLADTRAAVDVEVVVVDTGSDDGTAAALRAAHPDVRVLELDNAGFGRGANAGVRATSAPVVVVCNADVRFAPGAVEALRAAVLATGDIGAVGPLVRYPDGTLQASARDRPGPRTAVAHAVLGRIAPDNAATRRYHGRDRDPSRPRDVDWLSGCTIALRREAFERVGGFDPGFFLYVEDVDLGDRLRADGWRLRFDPAASVVHRVGGSTHGRRLWALRVHARSLERYLVGRRREPLAVLLRPVLRVLLAAWVLATYLAERFTRRLPGRGASQTGERLAVDPAGVPAVDPDRPHGRTP